MIYGSEVHRESWKTGEHAKRPGFTEDGILSHTTQEPTLGKRGCGQVNTKFCMSFKFIFGGYRR